MGYLDNIYFFGGEDADLWNKAYAEDISLESLQKRNAIRSMQVGEITSRDQIINPYSVVNPDWYGDSDSERMAYESDLTFAKQLAEQQTAAYQDFYNSDQQKAIRMQKAGLNPDILGTNGASDASGIQSPDAMPGSFRPSEAERTSMMFGNISSLVSGIASVASLPNLFATTKLAATQVAAQELANNSAFEDLVGSEISSRLSDSITAALDAGEASFDLASWFKDEANFEGIFESYAPSDTSRYRSSYNNARNRVQKNLAAAYDQGKVTAENRGSFAALAADPRSSSDLLIQVAATQPYMQAQARLEKAVAEYQAYLNEWNLRYQEGLDVNKAVDVANAQNDYNADYYKQLDSEKAAKLQNLIYEVNAIDQEMRKTIKNNYRILYDRDPYSVVGMSAAYLYNDAPRSWGDYWKAAASIVIDDTFNYNPTTDEYNTGNRFLDWLSNPVGGAKPNNLSTGAAAFIPPGSPAILL